MAKKSVNPDNIYTFRVGGTDYECMASLGASVAYKEEFIGNVEHPYTGILESDLTIIYRRTLPVVVAAVETDGEGNAVTGKDGNPVVSVGADGAPIEVPGDYEGACATIPNPDYFGMDIVAVMRFVWAMARAAGSVREGWDEWSGRVMDSPMSMHEQRRIFDKALYEVAYAHWFLDQEGRVDAEEPHEEQQA